MAAYTHNIEAAYTVWVVRTRRLPKDLAVGEWRRHRGIEEFVSRGHRRRGYIGAAIARKFAAEGFTVFAGRRHGEKLEPLIAQIEEAGGRAVAHRMV